MMVAPVWAASGTGCCWFFLSQGWWDSNWAVPGLCSRAVPHRLLRSGLLFFQMGFFKRARYPEATVPQYHAVKIPREDRQQFKEEKTGTILRNNWGSPRREGPDAHPILAGDGHPELGSDGHTVAGTA